MSAVAEPRVPVVGRYSLAPVSREALPRRQIAWTAVQAIALALLLGIPASAGYPDLSWALALGLGVVAAYPRRLARAAPAFATIVVMTLLAGVLGDGSSTVSLLLQPELAAGYASRGLAGAQVLTGGVAAGLALAWLEDGPRDGSRLAQLALAGGAAAGLGWWAAGALVPASLAAPVAAAMGALIQGLIASQVLVVAALRYRTADRIPPPRRIRSTLHEPYQPPCLRAWKLDGQLAGQSPDPETRDGLGEVAAWIYRLQWTLQSLDRELEDMDANGISNRVQALIEEAEAATDAFTRDRKLATIEHLQQLQGHRAALLAERERTSALVDYACAFLEEARAGLTLARVQPGEHTPNGLDDVLGRLRTHGVEREAHRRTAREVAALS